MLNAEQMRSLPLCFTAVTDPRRVHGVRHRLAVVLGIAAGATLDEAGHQTHIMSVVGHDSKTSHAQKK